MRKPKTPSGPADESPSLPGGRALGRARQFAQSRGLPDPAPGTLPGRKKPAAPRKQRTPPKT